MVYIGKLTQIKDVIIATYNLRFHDFAITGHK